MATSARLVKNAARNRYSARKAGLKIVEQNETKKQQVPVEQEQPDIM